MRQYTVLVFIFLAYFTLYNGLQFHGNLVFEAAASNQETDHIIWMCSARTCRSSFRFMSSCLPMHSKCIKFDVDENEALIYLYI